MDLFQNQSEIQTQLSKATGLKVLLDIMVGLVYDLTDFYRVMVYRFDETAAGIYFFSLVEQQTVMLLHMPRFKVTISTSNIIFYCQSDTNNLFPRLGGELVCRYSCIDRHLQRPSLSSVRYSKASRRAIRYLSRRWNAFDALP
jgi:hypothetical protein